MKMPSLKAKNKFKRHKGNIHFGKIILTFMLVGMMIFGNVEPVKASEPLYYYDRYTVKEITKENVNRFLFRSTVFYGDGLNHTTYLLDIYNSYGELVKRGVKDPKDAVGYYTRKGEKIGRFLRTETEVYPDLSQLYAVYEKGPPITEYLRGEYIETVTGTYNQYPANGVHTDGYWYVRKGLANNNPTITIATPNENSYFV